MEDILRQIENKISENNQCIALAASLKRLEANPDFQRVIGKGYLQEQAVELVKCYGNVDLDRAYLHESVVGIGKFHAYLESIHRNAAEAEFSNETHQAELARIEQSEE